MFHCYYHRIYTYFDFPIFPSKKVLKKTSKIMRFISHYTHLSNFFNHQVLFLLKSSFWNFIFNPWVQSSDAWNCFLSNFISKMQPNMHILYIKFQKYLGSKICWIKISNKLQRGGWLNLLSQNLLYLSFLSTSEWIKIIFSLSMVIRFIM